MEMRLDGSELCCCLGRFIRQGGELLWWLISRNTTTDHVDQLQMLRQIAMHVAMLPCRTKAAAFCLLHYDDSRIEDVALKHHSFQPQALGKPTLCLPPHPSTLPQVEYTIQDMGYLRFYLAPKIEDEDMEGEDEAP